MKKWRTRIPLAIVVLLVCGIGAIFAAGTINPFSLRNPWRKNWKNNAVAEIKRHSDDSAWVNSEITRLKAGGDGRFDSDSWLSRRMILATNGDWMVYDSFCYKQDFRIHDIFIAKASDGKWYYSTYHFCINMVVLSGMKPQPGSLAEFIKDYSVRQFDGQSDECLKKTWP